MTRRRFLEALGALPVLASPWGTIACGGGRAGAGLGDLEVERDVVVDDAMSSLEPVRVDRVLRPTSAAEVRRIVRAAGEAGRPLAIAGGRHATGGQQFLTGGWLLDTRGLDRVRDFDSDRGLVTVDAGIQWPRLFEFLATTWERGEGWGIVQKQTGADRLTLGGALAANIHGRVLTEPPIVRDIEAFSLVDAEGRLYRVDRESDPGLFRLAVGGYGLFGVVTDVTLRLARRMKVRRHVGRALVEDAARLLHERATEGHLYGDFQFSVDPESYPGYLREGVLTTYEQVPLDTPIPGGRLRLSPEEWTRLLELAHLDPGAATERYVEHYLATDGQVYWNDTHQLGFYREEVHDGLAGEGPGGGSAGSEMLIELFVPPSGLGGFMTAARAILRTSGTPVVYGTVRLIAEDDETFLPWAKRRYACVSFDLHVPPTDAARELAAATNRELIDEALERDGSFYLTYHRWASRDQVERAYPRFGEFLERKRLRDPHERFQSEWYRHWRDRFARSG